MSTTVVQPPTTLPTPSTTISKKVNVSAVNTVAPPGAAGTSNVIDPEFLQAISDSFEIIGKTYDLSENQEVMDFIRVTLTERFTHVKPREIQVQAGGSGKGGKGGKRKKVPYNLYISHRFAENKINPTGESTTELMSKFSKEWKGLTAAQQQPWKEAADQQNSQLFPDKVGKTKVARPMSGYNLYLKKHSSWFKQQYPELTSAQRMAKVGEGWKALSKPDQEAYKAEAINMFNEEQAKLGLAPAAAAAAPAPTPAVVPQPPSAISTAAASVTPAPVAATPAPAPVTVAPAPVTVAPVPAADVVTPAPAPAAEA